MYEQFKEILRVEIGGHENGGKFLLCIAGKTVAFVAKPLPAIHASTKAYPHFRVLIYTVDVSQVALGYILVGVDSYST